MVRAVKNLQFDTSSTKNSDENAQCQSFDRLEGEPTLWWNRFLRYRNLGPKRSLIAALEQERSQLKTMKSHKRDAPANETSTPLTKRKRRTVELVPTPRKLNIPGSWRDASVRWHWVERARAYDEWVIEQTVTAHIDELYQGYACQSHRIWELNKMVTALRNRLHTQGDAMKPHEQAILAGRIESILRDLREEMRTFDEQVARYILTRQVGRIYSEASVPPTHLGEELER